VSDGYFVHFFAPADLPPLRKHVIFVLDVSGSMNGRKIEQLKEAMATILGDLKQGDLFSIVPFSTTVQVQYSAPLHRCSGSVQCPSPPLFRFNFVPFTIVQVQNSALHHCSGSI
jgi:hypothetical protein